MEACMSGLRVAMTLVRVWSYLYTCGMSSEAAVERRDEIASDLWELQHDSSWRGVSPAMHVVARLLAGIPDDLVWRVECAAAGDDLLARRAVAAVGAAVAVLACLLFFGQPSTQPQILRQVLSPRMAECVLTAPPPQSTADFRTEIVTCAGAFFGTAPPRR
jgi:hypothetical protein